MSMWRHPPHGFERDKCRGGDAMCSPWKSCTQGNRVGEDDWSSGCEDGYTSKYMECKLLRTNSHLVKAYWSNPISTFKMISWKMKFIKLNFSSLLKFEKSEILNILLHLQTL